jgi:ribonuclease P protein component
MMVLYVRPAEHGGTRFGYSLSKKLGGAVQRNRMKRRLREICRSRVGEISAGFDLVVVGRSRLRTASFAEIQDALTDLCRKAKVMPVRSAQPSDSAE